MDEAEQLCDRLVVMDKGLIVAEGSPRQLIREHSTREVAELRFGIADETTRTSRSPSKIEDLGRLEVLPDRLLVYSPRRRGGHRQGARARPRARSPCSCGAPPSRTSSCELTGRTLVD